MMNEYVTKDNMRSIIETACSDNMLYKTLMKWVDALPTEDAAPIIHARWTDNHNGTFTCSNCNKQASRGNYCPHCGAKMDERNG